MASGVRADVTAAKRFMEKMRRGHIEAPRKFQNGMNAEMRALRAEMQTILEAENPRQSPTPYVWSTDPAANARARRWWFANYVRRFPHVSGRYQRTGRLVKSWVIVGTFARNSGVITLENPALGAKWVFVKQYQNPSHTRTGWKTIEQRQRQFTPMITARYRKVWERAGNPLKG